MYEFKRGEMMTKDEKIKILLDACKQGHRAIVDLAYLAAELCEYNTEEDGYAYKATRQIEEAITRVETSKRKHGKGKLNEKVKNLLEIHPKCTSSQIAEKIGNTSSDAVRQTDAWKKRQSRKSRKKSR